MAELKIISYKRNFSKIFEKEKQIIIKAVGINDVYHIGSTAVPGLGGKGIIDIMIGAKNWKEAQVMVKKLKKIGFGHVHPKNQGRIFLSKHREPTPDNFHIHIVKRGGRQYKEFLVFRDHLKRNKKEAEKYFNLKLELLKKTKGNRIKYTKLKKEYIKDVLRKIKSLSPLVCYLNKTVKVKIDRPFGSFHPKYKLQYGVNYGYVPGTKSADGEEVDAYVLGVAEPLKEFKGRCIAVIHRLNDNDDKLVIIPSDMNNISDKEIKAKTDFQEKFFKSVILRA